MDVRFRSVALCCIGLGVLLRLVIIVGAENRLGANESTVALMALDVLEGHGLPFFYYGNHYNGGAALESWIGALAFATAGPGAIPLKLGVLGLWTLAAVLFASLLARVESKTHATLALVFFVLATPFFLEWSVKARGGYAETLLFSVMLLNLAAPPAFLRRKLGLQGAAFGGVAGVAIWASEMVLALLPFAAWWMLSQLRDRTERRQALLATLVGAALGLLPLLLYNATHDWANLRASVLVSFFTQPRGAGAPLSAGELAQSARFVLGPAWGLLLAGLGLGAYRSLSAPEGFSLARVALLHVAVYLAAYALSGQRFLPMPPTRVLYILIPSLAVLLSRAVVWPSGAPVSIRAVSIGAGLVWLGCVVVPVSGWLVSGEPRETGSWRGQFCLIDAEGIERALADAGVTTVYANMWTAEALSFATRARAHLEGTSPLEIRHVLPRSPAADSGPAAFVLQRGSRDSQRVASFLREQGIDFVRGNRGRLALFTGIDAREIQRRDGLPSRLAFGDLPPLPPRPDGFN